MTSRSDEPEQEYNRRPNESYSDVYPEPFYKHALFVGLCLYIVFSFLFRLFATSHADWPSSEGQHLDMLVDLLWIVGAAGLYSRLFKSLEPDDAKRGIYLALLYLAVLAGIGMFVIRFSSNVGWWTGYRIADPRF